MDPVGVCRRLLTVCGLSRCLSVSVVVSRCLSAPVVVCRCVFRMSAPLKLCVVYIEVCGFYCFLRAGLQHHKRRLVISTPQAFPWIAPRGNSEVPRKGFVHTQPGYSCLYIPCHGTRVRVNQGNIWRVSRKTRAVQWPVLMCGLVLSAYRNELSPAWVLGKQLPK